MSEKYDIAIVGAGMAGTSLAAELGRHARTIVLEGEDQPGRHATGRSAAFWVQTYGGPLVQPLTTASGPWLAEQGFLGPRGGLTLAREEQQADVERFLEEFADSAVTVERLDRIALAEIVPGLRSQWVTGILEPECKDIDVAALHGWYLKETRRSGAEIRCRAQLAEAEWDGVWRLTTAAGGRIESDLLVNAAGAWADPVAEIAGVKPVGITPFRRTIAQLRTAPGPPASLPLVLDIGGQFYFKPEGGRLWLSPHDETPSVPCDAAPEELDIALAIDRFEDVVDWEVQRVEHKWAGLRSFAPDRLPVYGFDSGNPAFFWFAGQGGYGIQTAPAAARLAAQILLDQPVDAMTQGLDRDLYAAARFA